VLGADGVYLTSSYGKGEEARYAGHDAFDPVWEELDRRHAIVFLHGDQTPGSNRFPNRRAPIPVGEVPNETYKAAADLVTAPALSSRRRRIRLSARPHSLAQRSARRPADLRSCSSAIRSAA
jgi:hypothetical protein